MKELIEFLKKYDINGDEYDIIDGYVVMKVWHLDLSNNKLTHLPDSIGNLKVDTLYLNYNRLTHLPESICNLEVETLDLSGNNITHLPESICNIKVEQLYLYNNKIPKEGIKYLDRIENLKACWTDYSDDLETNIILSKRNSRKDKIKLLLD